MTIKEAQEYSREHGLTACRTDNNIKIDNSCYDAIAEIEYALDNGYQLCKVDEVIKKTQYLAKNIHSDCANACVCEFGDILKEACK